MGREAVRRWRWGETACGICSVAGQDAGPERLLAWNRGHWMVEGANHCPRDAALDGDASHGRAGRAPIDPATMDNVALATACHRGLRFAPKPAPAS